MPRPTLLGSVLLGLLALGSASGPRPALAGDARQPGGHADLALDRLSHDFGAVKQNAVVHTTFTYTNRGTQKVVGIAARGECGCSKVEVTRTELAPGESGVLEVEFNTLTLGGHLHKRVHLYSSDASRGEALVALDIAIVAGLVVRPAGISYGDVALGTHPTKGINLCWYEGAGTPFEITEVGAPDGFKAVTTPFHDPKDERWKGWRIELTAERDLPLGMYSDEVLVRTTDAERPRLVLALSANVCGKVWLQARRLSFGSFEAGRARSSSIKFRPFDESVHFGEVSAVSPGGRIRVEVRPDPYMADKGYWKLTGTVPEDAQPGPLDDEVVELHTGVPGEEVIRLTVSGRVRAPKDAAGGR